MFVFLIDSAKVTLYANLNQIYTEKVQFYFKLLVIKLRK